ncbi:septum formation initiator family protein [Alicyclobacillus sp. ALC3]|uniref:septum formation initiator family protein n=1 Tax=Alicyclobacillus sp. ALC3 TaxID=2796143 RepID=UPI002379CB39|nr:septum formation initiator family protein [Alicyclobacillus sp. ALC3]WDL98983.1 septum formation initiator family protein [Alicyclobacillus sp. ALC3]
MSIEMPQLSTLRHQQQSLQSQLSSLKAKQSELKAKVSEFNNKQFLAEYAARHFGLIAPGQQLFIVAPKH